jgi:hypothetical protein
MHKICTFELGDNVGVSDGDNVGAIVGSASGEPVGIIDGVIVGLREKIVEKTDAFVTSGTAGDISSRCWTLTSEKVRL